MSAREDVRARRLLGLGAVAGAALGLVAARLGGALGGAALPPGAIASVDGRPLLREEYTRALSLVAGDRREPPTDEDRARVLERLLDEDLLVQHALARGLLAPGPGLDEPGQIEPGSDEPGQVGPGSSEPGRAARDAVVRAMVESALADAASRAPSEDELRAFYERQRTNAADPRALPPFEDARPAVEAAYAQHVRDEALRRDLEQLRARARIVLSPDGAR